MSFDAIAPLRVGPTSAGTYCLARTKEFWQQIGNSTARATALRLQCEQVRHRRKSFPRIDFPTSIQCHANRSTVDGSAWQVVQGYHGLRHSFASNCTLKGVDQRIIDAWMGHQTEAMRRRYSHLFPEQQQAAIRSVFG